MTLDDWKNKRMNDKKYSLGKPDLMILLAFLLFAFSSCSDKYLSFIHQYQFKSIDGKPDYSDLNYWAAHPRKYDPSDSIPAPLRNEIKDTSVDVFFIHPTMYTFKIKSGKMNADIDDEYINAKTDYSTILYQSSVFNQQARIFAPRYREAHISAYLFKDSIKSKNAFDLAYNDIKEAFEYYLDHYNNGRPIIIASHSQGTTHAIRLLKDFFENKPLEKQLVVAYIVGMEIPKESFTGLKICADSLETGCICGWRTLRRNYLPSYIKKSKETSLITNPLTWKTDNEYASRKMNTGSILFKFNKIYKQTTDARIVNDVLWVKKPKFPWSFLYFSRNYHVGDVNLYYMNLKQNTRQRIKSYFAKTGS